MSGKPISVWIEQMRAGDQDAVQKVWEHYYPLLVSHARSQLPQGRRREADEEDHVQEAFHSFFAAIKKGRYRDLKNRQNLWGLLVEITLNKIHDHRRRQTRAKRGGGRVRGESAFQPPAHAAGGADEPSGIAQAPDAVKPPQLEIELAEECRTLIEGLADPQLIQLARLWLLERTQLQIAAEMGWSEATVARKQKWIREKWRRELEP